MFLNLDNVVVARRLVLDLAEHASSIHRFLLDEYDRLRKEYDVAEQSGVAIALLREKQAVVNEALQRAVKIAQIEVLLSEMAHYLKSRESCGRCSCMQLECYEGWNEEG